MASTSSIDVSHEAVLGKVRPPRKGLLPMSREAAASRLIEQLSWKVVTVEAPLGVGKTSFLADVYHRLFERRDRWRVAWLTVDERDDAERIFHHVLLAWKKELPSIEIDEFMLLHRRSADLFAVSFGNFLTQELDGSPVDYVLIVDDIDKADPCAMAEFFDCVTEYCPENFHVVASGSCALWESLGVRFRSNVYRYPQGNLQLDREMIRGILSNSIEACIIQEESPPPLCSTSWRKAGVVPIPSAVPSLAAPQAASDGYHSVQPLVPNGKHVVRGASDLFRGCEVHAHVIRRRFHREHGVDHGMRVHAKRCVLRRLGLRYSRRAHRGGSAFGIAGSLGLCLLRKHILGIALGGCFRSERQSARKSRFQRFNGSGPCLQ